MQITSNPARASEVEADWLIACLWQDQPLDGELAELDSGLSGQISHLRARGDITGKAKELTPLLTCEGIAASRLLVVGLGSRSEPQFPALVNAAAVALRHISKKPAPRVALVAPESRLEPQAAVRALTIGALQGADSQGLHKREPERFAPASLYLIEPRLPADALRQAVQDAAAEAEAVSLARRWVNSPPCDLYPESFAEIAAATASEVGLQCQVLTETHLRAERMGALLGVAQGSGRPPRVVVLRHRFGSGPTLGLVGKGVTFDSGGLSLKTTEQMLDMKCDMAGAATVLAAMRAIAETQVPANVFAVLAMVENMPSGTAMKLGDVLHARNGTTIEVQNTDAEGRLILADALSYAVDQKADHLVDLATLTGACMVALGFDVAGLMTNRTEWGQQVQAAADRVGELVWPLPMLPHFDEMIKSGVADIRNTGGSRYAGAITAAKFLERFVGDLPWVHLDIAGPAWAERENAVRDGGGTGAYVRTLVELARDYGKK